MRKELLAMACLTLTPFAAHAVEGGRRQADLQFPEDLFGPVPLVIVAPGQPSSRGNVARTIDELLRAGLAVYRAADGELPATAGDAAWDVHPLLDTGRIGLLAVGADAAGVEGRFAMQLRLTLACGGPRDPVLAAVLRPGADLPHRACAVPAAAWRLTGATADAGTDASDLWAASRLIVEPWPGSVEMSAGEVAAFLARALAGTGP